MRTKTEKRSGAASKIGKFINPNDDAAGEARVHNGSLTREVGSRESAAQLFGKAEPLRTVLSH